MSDNINRADLAKIAKLVQPALSTQDFIPAYKHICFNGKSALAFNDVAAIRVKAAVAIKRCVPGEALIRALASFSGESVALQLDDDSGTLLVSSGRSKLKFPTMPLNDYPFEVPHPGKNAPLIVGEDMLKGIERCLLSVGTDKDHPATMGVTLDVEGGTAVLYSTDNYTISRYITKDKVELPGDSPVILPTFFCNQLIALSKVFDKDEIELFLLPNGLLAEFEGNATLFTKTLVDLTPLDFPKIVKKSVGGERKLKLGAIPDAFDGALGRALLVLGGEKEPVTKMTLDDGTLKLHSESASGHADDSMSCEAPGDDMTCHVDPVLVLRGAKACSAMAFFENVLVLGDKDGTFIHLIAHCK